MSAWWKNMKWAIRILEWPAFEHVGGKAPWRVTRRLLISINGKIHEVPVGYCTDFASVPRIPGVYWRYGNTANIASLWHDYPYDGCITEYTRKEVDEQFLAIMEMLNDPTGHLRRRIMYRAVRMFGWHAWKNDTSWKCKQ